MDSQGSVGTTSQMEPKHLQIGLAWKKDASLGLNGSQSDAERRVGGETAAHFREKLLTTEFQHRAKELWGLSDSQEFLAVTGQAHTAPCQGSLRTRSREGLTGVRGVPGDRGHLCQKRSTIC